MQNPEAPWIAIVVMWVAALVMTAMFMAFVPSEAFITGLVMVSLAGIALGGTYVILEHIKSVSQQAIAQGREAEKSKRSNRERIERLVEALDEDEIIELETLLMAHEDDELRYDR